MLNGLNEIWMLSVAREADKIMHTLCKELPEIGRYNRCQIVHHAD